MSTPGSPRRITKRLCDGLPVAAMWTCSTRRLTAAKRSVRPRSGRLDVTQGAIARLEHSDDVRVSTLRQVSRCARRSALAWSLLRCLTTRTVGCRSTSDLTTPPDRAAGSTMSARFAATSADERGAAARELSRTTVVQHDEHQRAPTNAYDSAARRCRFARSPGKTPTSADQLPRVSVHSYPEGRRFKSCPRHQGKRTSSEALSLRRQGLFVAGNPSLHTTAVQRMHFGREPEGQVGDVIGHAHPDRRR